MATLDFPQHDGYKDGKDEQSISLHTASEEGKVDMVKMLLDWGTDINFQNASSETLLHKAADYKKVEVVRLLIKWGAEVDLHSH